MQKSLKYYANVIRRLCISTVGSKLDACKALFALYYYHHSTAVGSVF